MDENCHSLDESSSKVALVLASITLIIAVLLNIILAFTIFSDKKLRKRANIYLAFFSVSLALLAFMFGLDVISIGYNGWIFGNAICKISAYAVETLIILSTLILLWLCLDRYLMIFKINLYQKRFNNVRLNLGSTAVLACLFGVPFLFIYEEIKDKCGNNCIAGINNKVLSQVIFLLEVCIIYIVPVISMVILYIKILHLIYNKNRLVLAHYSGDSEHYSNGSTQNTSRVKRRKAQFRFKQAVLTACIIVGVFIITWTPFIVIRAIKTFKLNFNDVVWRVSQFFFTMYLCFYPLMYLLSNRKIRQSFLKKLKFIRCW
ncbi:hypothetical protein HZS_7598 [Henneguya salminicola]|nr:hypothetical protein HZS_7598 [Henneguya salminicola]